MSFVDSGDCPHPVNTGRMSLDELCDMIEGRQFLSVLGRFVVLLIRFIFTKLVSRQESWLESQGSLDPIMSHVLLPSFTTQS